MTVASLTNKSGPYNGNGSTSAFAVNTKYTAKSEVSVIVTSSAGVETTKVLDTHYTLTDPGDSGTVTFITSPTDFRPQTGETVTILTALALTQATDLTTGGAFSANTIEGVFDKLTRLVQQIAEKVTRAPKLRQTTTTGELTLPEPSASTVLGWNSAGTALENKAVADIGSATFPTSPTDNALIRADGTSGTVLQASDTILDDDENLSGIGNITGKAGGITLTGGTGSGDDIRITSTSNVTKGTINLGSATTGVFIDETNSRLAIGENESVMTINGSVFGSRLAAHGDSATEAMLEGHSHTDTAAWGAVLYGARSRGTGAAPTVVSADDLLLWLAAVGYDGTDYALSSEILFEVDGTPGANDMPGRIRFLTSADGSQAPAEAMRINSDQSVQVSGIVTLPNTGLHILDTNASHDLIIAPGSDLTADRTLTLTTGDADRTLTLSGNLTVTDATTVSANQGIATITFVIDGGGDTITTGIKGYLEIPFACTITAARALADQSGSIVVDIWKDTYANYPPADADSITASAPVTISSATKSENTTLTGWTTSISAGDILGFNVDSITTCERVTIALTVTRT